MHSKKEMATMILFEISLQVMYQLQFLQDRGERTETVDRMQKTYDTMATELQEIILGLEEKS